LFTPLIPAHRMEAMTPISRVFRLNLFKSDSRSSYNALMIVAQGSVNRRFNVAHYTFEG
jgi:hypothetical protein